MAIWLRSEAEGVSKELVIAQSIQSSAITVLSVDVPSSGVSSATQVNEIAIYKHLSHYGSNIGRTPQRDCFFLHFSGSFGKPAIHRIRMKSRTAKSTAPQAVSHSHTNWPWFVVGCILLAAGLAAFFWAFSLDYLSPSRRFLLMWLLPLASGFACGCFAGSLKVSGPVGTVVVAATGGFAVFLLTHLLLPNIPESRALPTGSGSPPSTSVPAAGNENEAIDLSWVSFAPIPLREERIKTFVTSFPHDGLRLRFTAPNWELDFIFHANPEMKVGDLHERLFEHFEMAEHVSLDTKRFPSGKGWWSPCFSLMSDGRLISPHPDFPGLPRTTPQGVELHQPSLSESGVKQDAILRMKVTWARSQLASGGRSDTQSKVIQPPSVDL
jgi:hypothetical protein